MFPTAIEKSVIPYCRISSSFNYTRVGGGTIKAGLITYTPLTYADRATYLNNMMGFNYAISTIEDVGTYEVIFTFGWEDNLRWTSTNFEVE